MCVIYAPATFEPSAVLQVFERALLSGFQTPNEVRMFQEWGSWKCFFCFVSHIVLVYEYIKHYEKMVRLWRQSCYVLDAVWGCLFCKGALPEASNYGRRYGFQSKIKFYFLAWHIHCKFVLSWHVVILSQLFQSFVLDSKAMPQYSSSLLLFSGQDSVRWFNAECGCWLQDC